MRDHRSVQKAPKGATGSKNRCLPGPVLAYELAVATLRICLTTDPVWIDRVAVQAISPVLAAAYVYAQSTIPTYLGQGKNEGGLGLRRPSAGAYPPCWENAALALKRLEQLGYCPAKVAVILEMTEADLLSGLEALPDYDTVVAARKPATAPKPAVSSPVAGKTTAPATAPTAPLSAEDKEEATGGTREARKLAEYAAHAAKFAAAPATTTPELSPEEVAELESRLTDDD